MGLFGKSKGPDPKEQVNQWTSVIRKEGYKLDRQVAAIHREEEKVKRSLKEAAKKGEKEACVVLAKEIVHSKKAVNKIYAAKAHMNSVQMQMKNQLAIVRLSGALEKSTEVMKSMQNLIRLPEIAATMRELSQEMTKAGIMEEMLEDTMESALGNDDDEMEEAAQHEVDRVLWEVTAGELGKAPAAHDGTLSLPAGAAAASAGSDEEDEEALTSMQARLEALRS